MKKYLKGILLLPFFVMVSAFLLVPAGSVLLNSFRTEAGVFSLANYREILQNPFYLQSFRNSLLLSLQSTAIALVIALVGAYALHRLDNGLGRLALAVTNMTSNFAGVPLAFAFMIILGNNGVFTLLFHRLGLTVLEGFNLYAYSGLLLVYVYFQVPLGILLLYPSFDSISESYLDAAKSLGAGRGYFWLRIGVPLLAPALTATAAILFANAMGAYATAYALTSGAFNLVPIRIGGLVSGDLFLKPNLASALSVILASVLLGLNFISRRFVHEHEKE